MPAAQLPRKWQGQACCRAGCGVETGKTGVSTGPPAPPAAAEELGAGTLVLRPASDVSHTHAAVPSFPMPAALLGAASTLNPSNPRPSPPAEGRPVAAGAPDSASAASRCCLAPSGASADRSSSCRAPGPSARRHLYLVYQLGRHAAIARNKVCGGMCECMNAKRDGVGTAPKRGTVHGGMRASAPYRHAQAVAASCPTPVPGLLCPPTGKVTSPAAAPRGACRAFSHRSIRHSAHTARPGARTMASTAAPPPPMPAALIAAASHAI